MGKESASIHVGHRRRLRERFFKGGLDVFADHEVVELMLYCAIPQRDVNALAHALIDRFGSIDGVLRASDAELMTVKGIGPHTCDVLHRINMACRYYQAERFKAPRKMRNVQDAITQAKELLIADDRYRMMVCYVAVNGALLTSRNFLWSERNTACTRKVVTIAMELNAHKAVILLKSSCAHLPPGEEKEIRDMMTALYNAEVEPIDCVIISHNELYSMRGEGLLQIGSGRRRNIAADAGEWLDPLKDLKKDNGWYRLADLDTDEDDHWLEGWPGGSVKLPLDK